MPDTSSPETGPTDWDSYAVDIPLLPVIVLLLAMVGAGMALVFYHHPVEHHINEEVDGVFATVEAMYQWDVADASEPVDAVTAAVLDHADLDTTGTEDGFHFAAVDDRVEARWETTGFGGGARCAAIDANAEPVNCDQPPDLPAWADTVVDDVDPGERHTPLADVAPAADVADALSADSGR